MKLEMEMFCHKCDKRHKKGIAIIVVGICKKDFRKGLTFLKSAKNGKEVDEYIKFLRGR